jgi:hypothetical protein
VAPEDAADGWMGLLRAAAAHLAREANLRVQPDLGAPGDDALVRVAVEGKLRALERRGQIARAPEDENERLRLFVRYHGLEVPPAPHGTWTPREQGFEEAVAAATAGPGRRMMLILSDLGGVRDVRALARAFVRARRRAGIAVAVPASRRAAATPDEALREIALARERRAAVRWLARTGIPVVAAGRGDDLPALLARVASFRERIRRAV